MKLANSSTRFFIRAQSLRAAAAITLVTALAGPLDFLTSSAHALTQSGGRFSVESSILASGGQSSHGGRFGLEGTVGPIAAPSANASRFQMDSGFWAAISVIQTAGAPHLKIDLLAGGLVRLSWPLDATGFVLQGCTDPSGATDTWQDVPVRITKSDTEQSVTVSASGLIRCYRLKK